MNLCSLLHAMLAHALYCFFLSQTAQTIHSCILKSIIFHYLLCVIHASSPFFYFVFCRSKRALDRQGNPLPRRACIFSSTTSSDNPCPVKIRTPSVANYKKCKSIIVLLKRLILGTNSACALREFPMV
jgi:hypothetical protein